jgi:DNA-binding NtrC family response regulator
MVATSRRYSILITDDDRGMRETLAEIVGERGFRPVLAESGDQAVEVVQREPIHLALLDMHMPRLTGLETLQLVRQIYAALPAILITADATRDLMRQAFQAHVFSVIPKPINPHVILNTVIRALGRAYGPVDDPPQPATGEPTP